MVRIKPWLTHSAVALVFAAAGYFGSYYLGSYTQPSNTSMPTNEDNDTRISVSSDRISYGNDKIVIEGGMESGEYVPFSILGVELKDECNPIPTAQIEEKINSLADKYPPLLSTYWLEKDCDDCPYKFYGRIMSNNLENLNWLLMFGKTVHDDACKSESLEQ